MWNESSDHRIARIFVFASMFLCNISMLCVKNLVSKCQKKRSKRLDGLLERRVIRDLTKCQKVGVKLSKTFFTSVLFFGIRFGELSFSVDAAGC